MPVFCKTEGLSRTLCYLLTPRFLDKQSPFSLNKHTRCLEWQTASVVVRVVTHANASSLCWPSGQGASVSFYRGNSGRQDLRKEGLQVVQQSAVVRKPVRAHSALRFFRTVAGSRVWWWTEAIMLRCPWARLTPWTDGCSWEIPKGLRRGSAQAMIAGTQIPLEPQSFPLGIRNHEAQLFDLMTHSAPSWRNGRLRGSKDAWSQ